MGARRGASNRGENFPPSADAALPRVIEPKRAMAIIPFPIKVDALDIIDQTRVGINAPLVSGPNKNGVVIEAPPWHSIFLANVTGFCRQ
jgi:hypothetical protein